jgi:hypothetical protein
MFGLGAGTAVALRWVDIIEPDEANPPGLNLS